MEKNRVPPPGVEISIDLEIVLSHFNSVSITVCSPTPSKLLVASKFFIIKKILIMCLENEL